MAPIPIAPTPTYFFLVILTLAGSLPHESLQLEFVLLIHGWIAQSLFSYVSAISFRFSPKQVASLI